MKTQNWFLCSLVTVFVAHMVMSPMAKADHQRRCGKATPHKLEFSPTPPSGFSLADFFSRVRARLDNRYKGYAVVLTDSRGKRLGFRRAGWAVDPCDTRGVAFDLNTESAIGSVTKLFTTVAVLKTENDHVRLEKIPMTNFLPHRWQRSAHPYYKSVSVSDLLRHQAGFRRSGDGEHISSRLKKGRELSPTSDERVYSNTSMGIFHFIFARWAYRTPYHSEEVRLQNASDDRYNREIQVKTSEYFNKGLYRQIFKPLKISATCDPRQAKFPKGQNQYFKYFTPARSYSSKTATNGRLLSDETLNCASGGLYMSAKDLATFMAAVFAGNLLDATDRRRMINQGPSKDLMGFWAKSGVVGGARSFVHNGARPGGSHASVVLYPNGYQAVFLANSPDASVVSENVLIEAFNAAVK